MDTPLSYVTSGPAFAPAIVLCHGLSGSAFSLTDAVERLLAAGYRVITPDFRGHGLSPRWREGDDGQVLVDDLVDLLTTLRTYDEALAASRDVPCPPRPVIIGHSMGGATAGVVALEHPELVSGAVCEDPALYGTRSDEQLLSRGQTRLRAVHEDRENLVGAAQSGLESDSMPEKEALVSAWASQMVDDAILASGVVCPPVPWEKWMRGLVDAGRLALVLTGDVPGSARVGVKGLEALKAMGWTVAQAYERQQSSDWGVQMRDDQGTGVLPNDQSEELVTASDTQPEYVPASSHEWGENQIIDSCAHVDGDHSVRCEEANSRCQAVMIPGAGHQVRRMCPTDFWAVTLSWLDHFYPVPTK
ncbi:alpha/beta hydrolase [Actinomyces vulturis]|uniref:alpha/beta hydrolase n=1 Tax=Actinomyces vulturis TaxID=1857645 RepID=UPI00083378C7|nr:alpha/beta fold hydrolase [Actinomyces vulturis]